MKSDQNLEVENRENLEAILNASDESMLLLSPDVRILAINEIGAKRYGYSVNELRGKSLAEIMPEEIFRYRLSFIDQCKATGKLVEFEDMRGEFRLMNRIQPLFNDEGQVDRLVVLSRDLTRQRAAEDELGSSEKKYRRIFENVQDTYYEASLDGIILEISPSVTTLTRGQYSRQELIGTSLVDFYHKLEEREAFYAEILSRGYVTDFELTMKNRDGVEVPCAVSSKIIFDADGRPEKICGNIRDISERKKTELQLANQARELLELNATKDRFFSIIAHDLRGPFGSFLNLTRILVEDLHEMSLGKIQQFATIMSKSALTIYEMLENLLEWSKMQRGLEIFEPVTINLGARMREFLQVLADSASTKQVVLKIDIPPEIKAYGDENMVESTLRNLVSNAIKFTQKGGQVTITARETASGEVQISVSDTGIGMSPEIVSKLFRLDVNVSRQGTDGEMSSGLGLILCKEFVERHGGKIWVESEENNGSAFHFTLPGKSAIYAA